MKRYLLIGCILTAFTGPLCAEPLNEARLLGLWQSDDGYLELNIDGTFFSVEQYAEDDVFGTYSRFGNVMLFTYGKGEEMVTTRKSLYFESKRPIEMRLVDADNQSVFYHKVRDF